MSKSKYIEDLSLIRKYNRSIAMVLGDRCATFLQQVAYHATWKEETYGAGEWRSSLREWHWTFPYWSADTIKRIIKECRDKGVLIVRKGVFRGRDAVWFSLNYAKLDEIGAEGDRLFEELRQKYLVQNARDDEDDVVQTAPPASANCTSDVVQNAPHLLHLSTTALSTTSKSGDAEKASPVPNLKTSKNLQELQTAIKSQNLSTFSARFAKTASIPALAKIWEIMLVSECGKNAFIAFTPKDKAQAKIFVQWCKECGEDPLEFLSWCITNWESIKYSERLKWANLGDYPSITTIFGLKERFLEIRRSPGSATEEPMTATKVYTSVDQIPKDHPQFAYFKQMVEKLGRVEVV